MGSLEEEATSAPEQKRSIKKKIKGIFSIIYIKEDKYVSILNIIIIIIFPLSLKEVLAFWLKSYISIFLTTSKFIPGPNIIYYSISLNPRFIKRNL